MYSCSTDRISEHADEVRYNRQRRTTLENCRIDSIMKRFPEFTEQYETRNAFCEDYETVRKYDADSTAQVIHDPQSTVFIRLQSQQITKRGDIYCFNRISVADNLKCISAHSRSLETNTIIHPYLYMLT